MRITEKIENSFYELKKEQEIYGEESGIRLVQIVGQLEDIKELCTKMTTQPIYEKFSNTNIGKLDFTRGNTAYDFENKCIVVYKDKYATIYFIKDYGKTWAFTKKELLCN